MVQPEVGSEEPDEPASGHSEAWCVGRRRCASPSFPSAPWCPSLAQPPCTGMTALGAWLWSLCSGGQGPACGQGRHRGSQSAGLSPVPRLRFEDWTYEDFQNVLDSEDEIEELSRTVVQVAKVTRGACAATTGCPGLPLATARLGGRGFPRAMPSGQLPSWEGTHPGIWCWAAGRGELFRTQGSGLGEAHQWTGHTRAPAPLLLAPLGTPTPPPSERGFHACHLALGLRPHWVGGSGAGPAPPSRLFLLGPSSPAPVPRRASTLTAWWWRSGTSC